MNYYYFDLLFFLLTFTTATVIILILNLFTSRFGYVQINKPLKRNLSFAGEIFAFTTTQKKKKATFYTTHNLLFLLYTQMSRGGRGGFRGGGGGQQSGAMQLVSFDMLKDLGSMFNVNTALFPVSCFFFFFIYYKCHFHFNRSIDSPRRKKKQTNKQLQRIMANILLLLLNRKWMYLWHENLIMQNQINGNLKTNVLNLFKHHPFILSHHLRHQILKDILIDIRNEKQNNHYAK